WSDRSWPSDFDGLVQDASGVLVFVHPNGIIEPIAIDSIATCVSQLGGSADAPHEAEQPTGWHPDLAPTQVQLVDLLQFIQKRTTTKQLRISIIISAWDI